MPNRRAVATAEWPRRGERPEEKPPPQPRARRQRSLSPRPQPRPALRGAPMASSEACRREANACRRRSKGSRAHNRPLGEAEQAPVRSGASRERLAAAASWPLPRNPPRHARPRERPEAAATRENGTRTPCRVWLDLDLSAPVKTRVPPAVHEAPATARRARTANARRGGQTPKRKAPRGWRVKSRASKRRRPQAARRERRRAARVTKGTSQAAAKRAPAKASAAATCARGSRHRKRDSGAQCERGARAILRRGNQTRS